MTRRILLLDRGYVELVRAVGTEVDIGRIASISYGDRELTDEHARRIFTKLLSRGEESPLEFAWLIFRVRAPIFVARQWMRHRIGSFMEKSLRHTKPSTAYLPANKDARDLLKPLYTAIETVYRALLAAGVPKEVARCVVPLGTYTDFYWGVNLRALMNFLRQRLCMQAQPEMRYYAAAVAKLITPHYPDVVARLKTEIGDEWPNLEV